jgi:hypothetical protein
MIFSHSGWMVGWSYTQMFLEISSVIGLMIESLGISDSELQ